MENPGMYNYVESDGNVTDVMKSCHFMRIYGKILFTFVVSLIPCICITRDLVICPVLLYMYHVTVHMEMVNLKIHILILSKDSTIPLRII